MAHRSERWVSKGYLWTEIRPSTAIVQGRVFQFWPKNGDYAADPSDFGIIG